jgi:Fe-S-cluster containining protein
MKKEAKQIARTISRPIEEFTKKIRGHKPYIYEMKKKSDGKCIFLEKEQCTIYLGRPLICRFYPFELKNSEIKSKSKPKFLFLYTKECPGINQGKILTKDFFRDLLHQLRKRS